VTEKNSQLVRIDGESAGRKTALGQKPLFGRDAPGLALLMAELGEPNWRGRQLAEALYRQRVTDLAEISTLPKALRERMAAEGYIVGHPTIAQVFQSADGKTVEYYYDDKGRDIKMMINGKIHS